MAGNDGGLAAGEIRRSGFPEGFVFGVATSAYQVEGACKEDGRGDSIWDIFSRKKENIKDGRSGDVAVDQYNLYKEDVELMAKLGFGAYRFSISWSRILPDGTGARVNKQGIDYYNNLIDCMLEKGIQPYVTLYHWDLPQYLQDSIGGWLSKKIVDHFANYAEVCFTNFGDRVKHWITINEPLQTSVNGYGSGIFAPGICTGTYAETFLSAHYQLLAHGAAVAVYRKKFKATQGGQIGLVVDCEWAEPLSDNIEDTAAAQRRIDFQFGWYLDPIFYGDYPVVMHEMLGDLLPKFSKEDKDVLQDSVDFIGLNHYTTRFVAHAENPSEHYYKVQKVERKANWKDGEVIGERAASSWLYIVPWGIRKTLNYTAKRYKNIPIYITENGMDDEEDETAAVDDFLNDQKRLRYFKGYLAEVAGAIRDGVDIRGYFAWSFLDNFEWSQGYTKRFGLVYVDYKNGLKRHPKTSALWFARFLKGEEAGETE